MQLLRDLGAASRDLGATYIALNLASDIFHTVVNAILLLTGAH